MSYLLTEIALEMLGYKFYDTNGTFHLTNFQNNSTLSETHPDEPSLQEFIEYTNEELKQDAQQQEPHTLAVQEESYLDAPTIPESRYARRTPAKALAKIMDYESEKIVNQISTRLEGSVSRRAAADSDEQLAEIINEERKLIEADAEVIHNFRELVESRLQRLDKRPYEKYAQLSPHLGCQLRI
uniref:Uncharacterized protein, isoform C n=1 Tax=Drosophila melanogaster TaxID=7227 RepID=X2J753_DROME|nr:uncharacterized protein Dmel_CG34179, isoform C [Drosophila melanogaster]AHN54169.1 uncharacterized protein Dmel_CG34179, isoform C [Drosophila melanogaster]|eukprot:NP_001285654.1 uncharacterized protein Dmel_CG34179, isoform C [Drosophila melanogaster]